MTRSRHCSSGFVHDYAASELLRQTQRSLVCPLAGEIDLAKIREAFAKLAAVAAAQKLKVTGEPFYVVKADPMVVVPNQREHEACLPVRGEAKEEGDVKPSRLEGGYHIVTTTEGVAGVRLVANAVQALATKATTARVRFYVAANQEGGVPMSDVRIRPPLPRPPDALCAFSNYQDRDTTEPRPPVYSLDFFFKKRF